MHLPLSTRPYLFLLHNSTQHEGLCTQHVSGAASPPPSTSDGGCGRWHCSWDRCRLVVGTVAAEAQGWTARHRWMDEFFCSDRAGAAGAAGQPHHAPA